MPGTFKVLASLVKHLRVAHLEDGMCLGTLTK
jgi:hypothetical protein